MKLIKKTTTPSSFLRYTRHANATYQDLDKLVSQELRNSLISEQFGICAYCQLKLNKTKIEHHCEQSICNGRDGQPDRRLDYSNLLVVCLGKGGRNNDTHCDTHKAKLKPKDGLPMIVNPTNEAHIKTIKYSSTGLVKSSNTNYDLELNKIIRLNINYLKEMRRKKWLQIFKSSKRKNGIISTTKMQRLLENDLAKKDSKFSNHFPGMSEFMLAKFCS